MKVLIGCERSGVVRRAFRDLGHDAWSCDVVPADDGGEHIQRDVRDVLGDGWDLGIFHPPCTRLCNSGVRWLFHSPIKAELWRGLIDGAALFNACLAAPIPRVAVENPIMHKHARKLAARGYDQIIQPWMFGDGECKATCLWLRGLPLLRPTAVHAPLFGVAPCTGRGQSVHRCPEGPNRARLRSVTFPGIALAMAEQWGRVDSEIPNKPGAQMT